MIDSWCANLCPSCGKKNWWNNGDESDLTGVDVEAIECFACHHRWWISEDLSRYRELEDAAEIGLESPS